ncbi:hypothetical protein EJD97_011029 [Solanum chilense]|uniref:Uncharacterized protein n=1 Tax=Solanum chilense TaxID=4083 RepID=A0A6N2BPE3_SOLCI|nr:hypothetical protein EJD97_011029 [Solanum chilense]
MTTSGVASSQGPWAAHSVGRRRSSHAIMAVGQQARSYFIIIALGQHTRSNDVKHGMQSSPSDNRHGRMASSVAYNLRPSTTCTVRRPRAWHAHMGLGQHELSDDVGHDMPSSLLGNTHGRIMSGV